MALSQNDTLIFSTLDEERSNLKQAIRERLLRQKQMVDEGERGQSFNATKNGSRD